MKTVLVVILFISMLSFAFMPKRGIFHLMKYIALAIFLALIGIVVVIQDTRPSYRLFGAQSF